MKELDDEANHAQRELQRSQRIRSLSLNGLALAIMAAACLFMFGEFAWQLGVIIFFVGVVVLMVANAGGD